MTDATERPVMVVLCGSDRPPAELMEPLEQRLELRYADRAGLAGALAGARALFLWDTPAGVVEEVWPRAGSVEWIHVAAAGVDGVLFDDLRSSDVVVTNARGAFDRPIAEFVLASILAFAKDLHGSRTLQRQQTWQPRETRSIAGGSVLVVGTGAIGREIARLLRAVGMTVRGAGRTARSEDPDFDVVVSSADLAAHVGWADHVVVVAPLTDATRDLVDEAVLSRMRPGAHLVNVGRGLSVDEDALAAALESGSLAAASLDVFRTEPLPRDHRLWTTPGVVVSPHMSGDVAGSQELLVQQLVDNARRWLDGEELRNVVDKQLGFVAAPPSSGGRSA